jgi:hypothetical protein
MLGVAEYPVDPAVLDIEENTTGRCTQTAVRNVTRCPGTHDLLSFEPSGLRRYALDHESITRNRREPLPQLWLGQILVSDLRAVGHDVVGSCPRNESGLPSSSACSSHRQIHGHPSPNVTVLTTSTKPNIYR